ncbi:hypothetical protein [Streptomyces sp. MUM 16J]|uniref:hypothetical protein n=1 Tax=Streptomyces sp. MUM 16J TaxID=2791988 RepID=UPI001F042758|nr:hypothetical protein [Streptomyces sp. MUM 16J]MCH0561412.1 hypothetical protein [Streptomyces sp. MUM 16J]
MRREDCSTEKRSRFPVLADEGVTVLERITQSHVIIVRAAVFDHLTSEQTRGFSELRETISPLGERHNKILACADPSCPCSPVSCALAGPL